jgi:hypothetical protein
LPANNKATVFISGKIYWAKVTGEPRPNYGGDAREWTFEFEPNEDGVKVLKQHKLTDRLKDKENPDRKVLVLRKTEFNKDGNPNPPIRLYDAEDSEWDKTKLIGNGSDGDVKLDIRDYGAGKKKGMYPVALRITELVQYQSSEFGGMDKGGDAGAKAPAKKAPVKDDFKKDFGLAEEDLDDEMPF